MMMMIINRPPVLSVKMSTSFWQDDILKGRNICLYANVLLGVVCIALRGKHSFLPFSQQPPTLPLLSYITFLYMILAFNRVDLGWAVVRFQGKLQDCILNIRTMPPLLLHTVGREVTTPSALHPIMLWLLVTL